MAINIIHQTKRELAEIALGEALTLLGNNPERNARYVSAAINRFTRGDRQKHIREWINGWLGEGKPGREWLARTLSTHPSVRRHFLARIITSILLSDEDRKFCEKKYGIKRPSVMLISPTMRCNFRCQGCYAASYERKDDMKPEVVDRVLSEAEDMGINFLVFLGGEPFIYPELFDILEQHKKSFFQIYTNASLIDETVAKRLAKMGNVAPQISVNGPAEFTDASRGKGAFEGVMRAMDNLREAGCAFGFSSLVSRKNMEAICTDEWFDLLVKKGALYGWLFLYMPVGGNPEPDLMPTPEQRNQLRKFMTYVRKTKPILPADFWSDGALTGGCIAAGREYFHVNHRGDVEPCIFCHFATHNIHNCHLSEALQSPFFNGIKEKQPFNYNTLRPCPMIDNPSEMWKIIQKYGAKPTHEGAEKMFTTFAPEIEKYADGVKDIMDKVWETEGYSEWAPTLSGFCHGTKPRLQEVKEAYEESNKEKIPVR